MKTKCLKNFLFKQLTVFFIFLTCIHFFYPYIFATNDVSIYADLNSTNRLDLHSSSALLMDASSGAILYSKGGFEKVYPASTTKILTAILAIEKLNLTDEISATMNALYSVPSDSSSMYIKIGEKLTVEQLLYGMLLQSGNDAANVIAEAVSGKISDFVVLMNAKAKEIGCINTNFVNAHGYHDDNHYSTAYDMALIFSYALKNEEFKKIISTSSYIIDETNKTNEKRYLYNTNKMLFNNTKLKSNVYYSYAKGGKTGYTEEAQGTYVGYAIKDGKTVISSCFKSPQNIEGKEGRFLDSISLYDYAFDNFNTSTVLNMDDFKIVLTDEENNKKYTIGILQNVSSLTNSSSFYYTYTPTIDTDKIQYDKKNNFEENLVVGSVDINFISNDWGLVKTYDLVLKKVEPLKTFWDTFKVILKILLYILIVLIVLFAILFTFLFLKNKKKKSRNIKKGNNRTYIEDEDEDEDEDENESNYENINEKNLKNDKSYSNVTQESQNLDENNFLLGSRNITNNRRQNIRKDNNVRKKLNYISLSKQNKEK